MKKKSERKTKPSTFGLSQNQNFVGTILTLLAAFFLVCMIAQPDKFIKQSLDGISAWAFNVLPSVLPFMFFTKLLSSLNIIQKLTRPLAPFSSALFKTSPISVYAFTMAILSGYPVGSKMVADLYMQGQITKEESFKMTSFCSTSGPMFIVGAVGIGMFKNSTVGYILFISHVLGAILNGIIFRNLKIEDDKVKIFGGIKHKTLKRKFKTSVQNTKITENIRNIEKIEENNANNANFSKHNTSTNNTTKPEHHNAQIDTETTQQRNHNDTQNNPQNNFEKQKIDISELVTSSTLAILSVGCIITIFFIVIECFSPILNLLPDSIAYFLEGVIEITKGCLSLSNLSNIKLAVILCSFVISFGGISTLLQSITMLNKVKMPIKIFVLQKLSHGILSAIISIPLVLLLL